jgi:hypothetical protein
LRNRSNLVTFGAKRTFSQSTLHERIGGCYASLDQPKERLDERGLVSWGKMLERAASRRQIVRDRTA